MLKVYRYEQNQEWDAIVRSFSDYDVYWLSGYVRAFQLHGDGEPMLFCYEDEDVRGINVVMKRDVAMDPHFVGKLPEDTYFDFSTPYGYGGWLIEGERETQQLFDAYEKWCVKHKIVSEFVRFHPLVMNHKTALRAYDIIPLGEVVAIDLSSPERIWEKFSSTCRNRVRKAENSHVRIFHGNYPEIYETFRAIYDKTMDHDHAIGYYYFDADFYKSIMLDLADHAQVFYAQTDDGAIVAAAIMLLANGYMNYHLGGSLREYSTLAPMNQLFYKAALWGCANGCRTLYLGGGLGSGDDSLLRFKRTFYRGELSRFHIGRKVFDIAKYNDLVTMREADDPMIRNASFFPAYRAGGVN